MEDGTASRLLMRETRGKDGVSYSLERRHEGDACRTNGLTKKVDKGRCL